VTRDFQAKRRVQFAETDLAGVLHFSNYYRYMEELEHAFWRSLGLAVMIREGDRLISWPRVATSCEYFGPAYFEDELDLGLTVLHVGMRSIAFEIEFQRAGERLALGRATAVCCATRDGSFEPVAIPDHVRAKLPVRASTDDDQRRKES
jgi:YbgC/YbaW family acyl-CoA thioester hydrolase